MTHLASHVDTVNFLSRVVDLVRWKFLYLLLAENAGVFGGNRFVESHVVIVSIFLFLFFLHEVTDHLLFETGEMYFDSRNGLIAAQNDSYVFWAVNFGCFFGFGIRDQRVFENLQVLLLNCEVVIAKHLYIPVGFGLLWHIHSLKMFLL